MTYVYSFGGKKADGSAKMKDLLGGKGGNLAEMTNLGLTVPPGFTLSTEVCTFYSENGKSYPKGLEEGVEAALKKVEKLMGAGFGDGKMPLLLSVRSGARESMPGMMDTVLNIGLNDETVQGLIKATSNERFSYDCYRRLIQMYGNVVLKVKHDLFESILEAKKKEAGIKMDTELTRDHLKEIVEAYKEKANFPDSPKDQLWGAIGAVFESWNNPRAIEYRRINRIPGDWGTAVNVQAMVYGNMGEDSATGVAFTRDPAIGVKNFYGEYLTNAQGEDVVAGIRTPKPISELEKEMPEAYGELERIFPVLENHYRDMQDLEFTIQKGKLWMLQTRAGKRTGFAAVRIAVEMAEEGLISEEEALVRVDPDGLNQILRPIFDHEEKRKATVLAKGLNAGPGAASGRIVFDSEDAADWAKKGEKVLLVRMETTPEDIKGMNASEGILTARGGMTSHAALVARQMGKTCIVGCGALEINEEKREMAVNGHLLREGDPLSIDGSTGEVLLGEIQTIPSEVIQVLIDESKKPEDSEIYSLYMKLLSWADRTRKLGVRANADQPDQCRVARAFGAKGVGLCRTEHMFFGGDRIQAVREMILSEDLDGRQKALTKLLPMQRQDFIGIFEAMDGMPVTVRTLDPPLHEFLPHGEEEIESLAKEMGVEVARVKGKMESLKEFNPMLGFRGCRLGILYPEITEMQAQAIFEAAADCIKRGIKAMPEVMIPLVSFKNELKRQEEIVRKVAERVMKETRVAIDYTVGTMIEIPRAALTADEIASVAEFFSFGTNDLTQTTMGLSRDDAAKFLGSYIEQGILKEEPFQTVDQKGVGLLMKIGVEKGRSVRKDLKVGICGEHGGDPASVEFCHDIGLDYVSCSPFRIPIARLAAARAVLKEKH
jgi:pyruvate,orthophosphate dikinase